MESTAARKSTDGLSRSRRPSTALPPELVTSTSQCAQHATASNMSPDAGPPAATSSIDGSELEQLRSEVTDLSAEVEEQRLLRQLAECEVSKLRTEADELRRLLRGAERSAMTSEMEARRLASELDEARRQQPKVRHSVSHIFSAKCLEEVVSALATLELNQLSSLSQQERAAAKRRLLLRWHPDKNGTGGGGELATRLMQELQTRPEWVRL